MQNIHIKDAVMKPWCNLAGGDEVADPLGK